MAHAIHILMREFHISQSDIATRARPWLVRPLSLLSLAFVLFAPIVSAAEPTLNSADFTIGSPVFSLRSCIVTEGPNQGDNIAEGIEFTCSRIEPTRIWVSGPISGWLPMDSLLNLETAERDWKKRTTDPASDQDSVATLAYIQMLLQKHADAQKTIQRLTTRQHLNLYARVMMVIIPAYDVNETQRQIDKLCEERVLTSHFATLLATRLRNAGAWNRAKQVVDSFDWDEHTESAEFLACAADVIETSGDLARARRLADLAVERDSYYGYARRIRAWILAKQGLATQSVDALDEWIKLCPDDGLAKRQLGLHLIQMNRFDEGLQYVKRSLDSSQIDPATYFDVGKMLITEARKNRHASGDSKLISESSVLFEKSCELTKYENIEFVTWLCVSYAEEGKHELAIQLIDQLTKKYPPGDPRQSELKELDEAIGLHKMHQLTATETESK
jgi:tetratricopeptide (TPR) repeat protein